MTFEGILKDIKERKFSSIYFLCGDEPYYIDKISQALVNNVLSGPEREFNQHILYGLDTDVSSVIAACRQFPMMSEFNLVVVKEAQHLRDIDSIQVYFERPSPTTILVLCYKNKKLDKRKSTFKTLGKTGIYFESKALYENQVPEWITAHLNQAGFHISMRNALMITEFLGTDLSHISNELGKIILNLPQGSTISGEMIEEFIGINKEYNTFELSTALGHRNIVKANRIINYFGQNERKYPLPMIIGILYSHFTKILKLHYVQGKSRNEQAGFLGVHPFFIRDYELAVKHYRPRKLLQVISILHSYDLKSKGYGNSGTGDGELMKEMVYKILH